MTPVNGGGRAAHALELEARHGQARGRAPARRPGDVDPLAQPVARDLHAPRSSAASNCAQEAQVVFEEQPQVVDAVAQHRQPLDAHAEAKPV